MTELIITEKPSSAQKVAMALADNKAVMKKSKQSSYYELTHGKQKIIVTSAVGHLYRLVEEKKNNDLAVAIIVVLIVGGGLYILFKIIKPKF